MIYIRKNTYVLNNVSDADRLLQKYKDRRTLILEMNQSIPYPAKKKKHVQL
jgi:hypothetical protein